MPCYDSREDDDRIERLARLDTVTDLLCRVGRALYAEEPVPQDVQVWWAAHANNDALCGRPWQIGPVDGKKS